MGNRLFAANDLRKKFDLYLTDHERSVLEIKARAARLPMSTFLRNVAIDKEIQQPPSALSFRQHAELARVGGNLNQLAAAVNAGRLHGIDVSVINELAEQVRMLRLELIGATGAEPVRERGTHDRQNSETQKREVAL